MKRNSIFLFATFICLTIMGCSYTYNQRVTENYYLIAGDVREQMTLCFRHGDDPGGMLIINQTVFAVGYNDKYIIVKQHPKMTDMTQWKYPEQPDKNITNYYIVPIHQKEDNTIVKDTIGPLTLEQFNNRLKELKIPGKIDFTIVLNDLK